MASIADIEIIRLGFVVGIVIAAAIYFRFRLVSGGLLTASYVAILLAEGSWYNILGWLGLSIASYLILRLFTYLWALPKAWLMFVAIITSTVLHTVLVLLSGGKGQHLPFEVGGLQLVLDGGMYITPGLLAYDLRRQGVVRTIPVLAIVVAATLGSMWLVGLFAQHDISYIAPHSAVFTDMSFPIVMLMCVLASEAMRLGLGWGSGGIIGSIFVVELFSWQTLLVIIVLVAITAVITNYCKRILTLTPRQWYQFTMVLGALIGWAGLSIGAFLGIEAAYIPNMYAVEPLLAIGLIASDVVRFGTRKTISGKVIVLAIVFITNYMLVSNTPWAPAVITLMAAVILFIDVRQFQRVKKGWAAAAALGKKYPILKGR